MQTRPIATAVCLILASFCAARAEESVAVAPQSYAAARDAVMSSLESVNEFKLRADIIAKNLVQRDPAWSWRWRHIQRFIDTLAGKPGFEKTLMQLGSDNPSVRKGALRTLFY